MRGKIRFGRGFSLGELAEAGVHYRKALKLGIPFDSRRRTVYRENIEAVKRFIAETKKPAGSLTENKGK